MRSPLLLLALQAALAAGCGNHSRETDAAAQSPALAPGDVAEKPAEKTADANRVLIDNFAFSPRVLTIAAGARVTWINRDDVPHTATSDVKPRLFDSGTLDTDDRFEHVFKTPGVYDYFCAVHPHMTGRIIVK
jgi:plastocyanin